MNYGLLNEDELKVQARTDYLRQKQHEAVNLARESGDNVAYFKAVAEAGEDPDDRDAYEAGRNEFYHGSFSSKDKPSENNYLRGNPKALVDYVKNNKIDIGNVFKHTEAKRAALELYGYKGLKVRSQNGGASNMASLEDACAARVGLVLKKLYDQGLKQEARSD